MRTQTGRHDRESTDPVRATRSRRAGFSLVEACIGVTVLTIALGGLSSTMLTGYRLQRTNHETVTAQAAGRSMMEALRGATFAEVYALYDADPTNDPAGNGTAPGANFAVDGLNVLLGDADGMCGSVEFPTVVVGAATQLREDSADAALGMPRDLNGDGAVDALDHTADYVILPVRVRVTWTGVNGRRQLVLETILCDR